VNRSLETITKEYDYAFPEALIAQKPASPRDSAKLLVYDRKDASVVETTFTHIGEYLPSNAILVFNQTKVIPARLTVTKPTGGVARILYIETVGGLLKAMSDRKLTVGTDVSIAKDLFLTVIRQEEKYYFLRPSFPLDKLGSILDTHGITPIPPYIKESPLNETELRKKYQTVFAKHAGSVAAPTASLHFTDRLLKKLRGQGIDIRFVTLHVNIGTFAPLTQEHIDTGALHIESYEIDKETAAFLNKAKQQGRPIIGVGTTVVRTLESACPEPVKGATQDGTLKRLSGETRIFIREGYRFKFVDGMVTNFHVPQSSLLMLVAALIGKDKLFELYRLAIKHKFRLFSFGDGMLIR
jgi:S-adenosylmethionine:tRNA ribosyltransferase-isomerase